MAFVSEGKAYRFIQREMGPSGNKHKGYIDICICILDIDWKAFLHYHLSSILFFTSLHGLLLS